jgi:ribosomal protein L40E
MGALRKVARSVEAEIFEYPTGMVWCPMKMSGMAIMKCARLQKELGCGTRRDLQILKATDPNRFMLFWPWLQRRGECSNRARDEQIREILRALSPLKLAERSRKNPRSYVCQTCGGRKTFGARHCRKCFTGGSSKRA